VVLVADHGEEFFEHGRFGHNRTLFEEVVRVPLILRYPPGLPAGKRVQDLASLADVAPTLLELARIPRPATMWGRSLWPAVHGELEERAAPLDLRLFRDDDPIRAVRGSDYKLLREGAAAPVVLYDLERDPGEHAPAGDLPEADPRLQDARGLWVYLENRLVQLGPDPDSGAMPAELKRLIDQAGYTGHGLDKE
jgi:arylsulfatase A-like enzyme